VKASYTHVSTSNTVRDIIDYPAFEGFGQFILPLELGYDENMPLTRVESLLPYHSNVKPDEVVNAINTMIDEVNDGQTIFYDYYTDAQKRKDLDRASTGLFYFRGNPGAHLPWCALEAACLRRLRPRGFSARDRVEPERI